MIDWPSFGVGFGACLSAVGVLVIIAARCRVLTVYANPEKEIARHVEEAMEIVRAGLLAKDWATISRMRAAIKAEFDKRRNGPSGASREVPFNHIAEIAYCAALDVERVLGEAHAAYLRQWDIEGAQPTHRIPKREAP